jgi:iron(III) transport system permease protein
VSLSLVIPLSQLLIWFFEYVSYEWSSSYWSLIKNTFFLGLIAASVTATLALGMVLAKRVDRSSLSQALCSISLLGYALPGNLVAVAVFLYFQQFKPHVPSFLSFLTAPLVLLILGYLIRYLSVSYRTQNNALKALNPNFDKVAKTLGVGSSRIFKEITFPLISPAFIGSFVLLFIEVIKEMPMTLMLRPFGMNTLAVRIYELTSEGEWQRASIAAVLIVVCGMLGTLLISRMDDKKHM